MGITFVAVTASLSTKISAKVRVHESSGRPPRDL